MSLSHAAPKTELENHQENGAGDLKFTGEEQRTRVMKGRKSGKEETQSKAKITFQLDKHSVSYLTDLFYGGGKNNSLL